MNIKSIMNSSALSFSVLLILQMVWVTQTQASEVSTAYEYNEAGYLTKIDGPRLDVSDITTIDYHNGGNIFNLGKIRSITNSKNQNLTIDKYNSLGKPEEVVDPTGVVRRYYYDSNGNLVKATISSSDDVLDAEVQAIEFGFDESGYLESVRYPSGEELLYARNGLGWVTQITNKLGEKIQYTYDDAGNIIRENVLDANNELKWTVESKYDELGRPRESVWPSGRTNTLEYDEVNRRYVSTDSFDNKAYLFSDGLERLSKKIHSDGGEVQFGYNFDDLITSFSDPNNNVTKFSYDDFGNLIELDSPDTGISQFEYDQAGNRIKETDARGVVTEFRYDELNRLIGIDYPSQTEENVEYIYDEGGSYGVGRLANVRYADGEIHYFYNYLGQVVQKEVESELGVANTYYKYSVAGLLEEITYPSGRVVRYERDDVGRIEAIFTRENIDALEKAVVSGVTYLPFGPANYYHYGNGLIHSIEYDLDYRASKILVGGIDPVLDRFYEYDLENNVKEIINNSDAQKDQYFSYDASNRLVDAEGSYGKLAFSYDQAGNRLERVLEKSDGTLQQEAYVHGENNNQLLYVDTYTDGVPSQSREFTYDAAGNRIEGTDEDNREVLYEYNRANRLWRVSHNGQVIVEYGYNPLGQRVNKSLENGLVEHYHYNESGQLIAVMNDEGISIREYIYRDNEQIAVIARPENNQSSGQSSSSSSSQSQQFSSPILLYANSAEFSGNHVIATDQQNYTGDGFIDFIGEGSASWEVDVPTAGDYLVDVRYAVSGGNRPLDLMVNGSILQRLSFPSTGSFNAWESVIAKVSLSAGNQTLSLATAGASGPNIDRLELQPVQLGAAIKVDESGSSFVGAHLIASNFAGYDGVGFIDVAGEGEVHWSVTIPREGSYLARVRYALGAGPRPMQLSIGGQLLSKLNFAPTGTFENWNELLVVVSLPAGSAQLRLSTLGASGPNIDFIELIDLNGGEGLPEPQDPISSVPQMYFIHNDHLGTPQVVTNINQQVAWMADYLPFGKMVSNPAVEMELYSRFPGQYIDEETGLYHNYFRDYDPAIGRYIQSDPIGLLGGMNTYLYAYQNPTKFSDFYGLDPGDWFDSLDDAAVDALCIWNRRSINNRLEYAGQFYQSSLTDRYSYTEGRSVLGGRDRSNPYALDIPWFTNSVGVYHTHGNEAPEYGYGFPGSTENRNGNNNFSDTDIEHADKRMQPSYLGTPSEGFWVYDPVVGRNERINSSCYCSKGSKYH